MDADVGLTELGLNLMMNQARPHCGFPEAAYNKYAEILVNRGYKVARVEQTERPNDLKERNRIQKEKGAGGKGSKVVDRKVCDILTRGTITDPSILGHHDANFAIVIFEQNILTNNSTDSSSSSNSSSSDLKACSGDAAAVRIGVCYFDCSTGRFFVGSWLDDVSRSQLRTLIGQISPSEVIHSTDPCELSDATRELLHADLPPPPATVWSGRPSAAFRAIATAVDTIKECIAETMADYGNTAAAAGEEDDDSSVLPAAICHLLDTGDVCAQAALSGCVEYLSYVMRARDLLSQRHFSLYDPSRIGRDGSMDGEGDGGVLGVAPGSGPTTHLLLDGQTLSNLEILRNSDGGVAGTLLHHVDQCVSSFGKRKMREWVTRPLSSVPHIVARQEAVDYLLKNPDFFTCLAALKKLPDLERKTSRIHAYSVKKAHNEVLYGNVDHKKIKDFCELLKGFDDAIQIMRTCHTYLQQYPATHAPRLQFLTTVGVGFPNLRPLLRAFTSTFVASEAMELGFIVPASGANLAYDEAVEAENEVLAQLQEQLHLAQRELRDSSIVWKHVNRERYQLEVRAVTIAKMKQDMPDKYELKSSTTNVKRYWTREIEQLVNELDVASTRKETQLKDATRRVFATFARDLQQWHQATAVLAELDCLASLARVSAHQSALVGCEPCRPQLVSYAETGGQAFVELRQCVHPVLACLPGSERFVANDIVLGTAECLARMVIVSGSNMGGKSTTLRQTCVNVLLAQMGAFLPAASCRLTPIEQIFTRVGANDRIMQGQSTFQVELSETASILRLASPRSLVILDELGRGTSTFDGSAIAHAVIQFLAHDVRCLTLFSTHYHMLMAEFEHDPSVALYHMAVLVQQNSDNTSSTGAADVTFLYQFQPGRAEKSHGMNIATKAGLPSSVVRRAVEMAELFEAKLLQQRQAAHSNANSTTTTSNDATSSMLTDPAAFQARLTTLAEERKYPDIVRMLMSLTVSV